MAARFLETAIPMQGRMLHTESGKLESQLYDPRSGQVKRIVSGAIGFYTMRFVSVHQFGGARHIERRAA